MTTSSPRSRWKRRLRWQAGCLALAGGVRSSEGSWFPEHSVAIAMRCQARRILPDTPRTGNRGRESGDAGQGSAGLHIARPGSARQGKADTPHPFAGAAVCYGSVMQCAAWSGTAQQTRRASSGARKFARSCTTEHGLAMRGKARRGRHTAASDGRCSLRCADGQIAVWRGSARRSKVRRGEA